MMTFFRHHSIIEYDFVPIFPHMLTIKLSSFYASCITISQSRRNDATFQFGSISRPAKTSHDQTHILLNLPGLQTVEGTFLSLLDSFGTETFSRASLETPFRRFVSVPVYTSSLDEFLIFRLKGLIVESHFVQILRLKEARPASGLLSIPTPAAIVVFATPPQINHYSRDKE